MSTEPERDIEKALRDYARHRADTGGTSPALHPPTRKLLQDEVARQNRGAQRAGGPGLFWASWPGFILKGSAALALLVVGALVLTPLWRGQPETKPATLLAKNEALSDRGRMVEKKETPLAQNPARDTSSAATPPSGGILSRKMDQPEVAATEPLKDAVTTPNPDTQRTRANPTVAPPVSTAPTLAMKSLATPPATAPAANAAPAIIAAPIAAPPLIASDSTASLDFRTTAEAAGLANLGPINQEFTRVNPPAAGGGRGGRGGGGGARGGAGVLRTTVLQSFRVEQNGGQIRVIDSDGSIYTGVVTLAGNLTVQPVVNGPVATSAAAQPATALEQEKARAPQNALAASAAISPVTTPPALPSATNAPATAAGARSIAPPQSSNAELTDGLATRSNAPRSYAPVAGYFFRVSGTNLTLNQPVEFSGNFVTNDPAASAQFAARSAAAGGRATGAGGGGGGFGGGGGIGGAGVAVSAGNGTLVQTNISNEPSGNPSQATGGTVSPAPSFNFRLQGQAVIGTNQVGINAVPTRP